MNLNIRNRFKNSISTPNSTPLLVFGFPKSGTSVISGLLAHRANKTLTSDTRYLWEPYLSKIKTGEIDMLQHINKFSYPFSKDIIKEPNMIFIIDKIIRIYDHPKVLIIRRDKLNNIKSVLNRLKIRGDLKKNPERWEVNSNWHHLLFDNDRHYIDVLNTFFDQGYSKLLQLEEFNPIHISYETFNNDKLNEIDRVVKELGFCVENDIRGLLDKQFQPKSKNKEGVGDFFGENLKKLL